MEWSEYHSQFVEPLECAVSFVLLNAPEEMKAMAQKMNKINMEACGYKIYVGLDFRENNMYQLKTPAVIVKENEHIIFAEILSAEGMRRHRFPRFGVCCKDGKIIAIENSIREECLLLYQSKMNIRRFLPSALDVIGKYEEPDDH